jgi:hypothetical protein
MQARTEPTIFAFVFSNNQGKQDCELKDNAEKAA